MGGWAKYFVILADMRTGSNALEERLSEFTSLTLHGEAFNPHFIGKPKATTLAGFTLSQRDANPTGLIEALKKEGKGLAGFRLFSDHDPRVFEHVMSDPDCAKIVLIRNPLDSYVSLKIARGTGQWWLGDLKTARKGKARFDAAEFEEYLSAWRARQSDIRHRLQTSGQTAFTIRFEDVSDDDVILGAARFLGVATDRGDAVRKGKIQNPAPLSQKVENYAEMSKALASRDPFDIEGVPNFEPVRGANVPSYLACRTRPLLYLPVKATDIDRVQGWMAALDGTGPDKLDSGFTQKTLRQWKRKNSPHRTFTVVAHPVDRAHRAFVTHILRRGPEAYPAIRQALETTYSIPLPADAEDAAYDKAAHRKAFLAFLEFLRGNISGQTSIRVDGAWATQTAILQGISDVILIDHILREDDLSAALPGLVAGFGAPSPALKEPTADFRIGLAEIYDKKIESAARNAYVRDYMMFGFSDWRPAAG
jgi:hypothetical protein